MRVGWFTGVVLVALPLVALAQGRVEAAGKLRDGRVFHTVTKLKDGRVLVVGGQGVNALEPLQTTELFDLSSKKWSAGPSLHSGRANHAAVLLADGRVLIVGGTSAATEGSSRLVSLNTAEVFDPRTNAWTPVASMHEPRSGHTAIVLNDGRVLVVGGRKEGRGRHASCELFDPTSLTWSETGALKKPRWNHEALLLTDGSVLVVGGASEAANGSTELTTERTERFDAASGAWESLPATLEPISNTAAVLHEKRAMIIGGSRAGSSTNYVEVLSSDRSHWVLSDQHLNASLSAHTATSLPNDDVVVIGGEPSEAPESNLVRLWNVTVRRWCEGGVLKVGRKRHRAVLLNDGSVLVVGGVSAGLPESMVERWFPVRAACVDPAE